MHCKQYIAHCTYTKTYICALFTYTHTNFHQCIVPLHPLLPGPDCCTLCTLSLCNSLTLLHTVHCICDATHFTLNCVELFYILHDILKTVQYKLQSESCVLNISYSRTVIHQPFAGNDSKLFGNFLQ